MKAYNTDDLKDGETYFCVKEGLVFYLEARIEQDSFIPVFFLNDIHGGYTEMFDAWKCSLIYM